MTKQMACIFVGAFVHSIGLADAEYTTNGLIAVSPQGKIALVERDIGVEAALAMIGWRMDEVDVITLSHGEFLIPGFIDTHTHAPQYPNLGRGQQYELLDWLQNITFPTEALFANSSYARETYNSVVRRSIAAGTTTSCYYGTLHADATCILADIIHETGQRAFIGKCNMDRNATPTYQEVSVSQSMLDTQFLIDHIHSLSSPLLTPILTPRFAIACTSQLLSALGALPTSLPVQTHISENHNEIDFTKHLFPDIPHYAGVYDHFGLLRENTILAHACHLEDEEMKLIRRKGAGISHCPTSNFNLRSGLAPVGKFLDMGIKVGLGTDVSGGYDPSILTAIRHASICSKIISMTPPAPTPIAPVTSLPTPAPTPVPMTTKYTHNQLAIPTLLHLSTLGGAQVCNLSDRIGNFVVGKEFDALLVSLLPASSSSTANVPSATTTAPLGNPSVWYRPEDTLEDIVERFLSCGDDRNIRRVYVAGKLIGGINF